MGLRLVEEEREEGVVRRTLAWEEEQEEQEVDQVFFPTLTVNLPPCPCLLLPSLFDSPQINTLTPPTPTPITPTPLLPSHLITDLTSSPQDFTPSPTTPSTLSVSSQKLPCTTINERKREGW